MRYLNILADDLTGAADTAARCRDAGLPTTIFVDSPQQPLRPGALAFTSDSRHLPAEEAARRVHDTAAPLLALKAHWYKKIDSTLRGNIGSELDAMLGLLDAPAAVVCPAFPAQKRGLRNGYLAAPELGLAAVHLPSLLRKQSRYPVSTFSLEEVRGGQLAAGMRGRRVRASRERMVLAVDALTEDDLETVLQAQQEALPDALLCGSAGLAGAFVRGVGLQADLPSAPPARDPGTPQSVLVVVGSGSDVAHEQIASLLQATAEPRFGRLHRFESKNGRQHLSVSRLAVTRETGAAQVSGLDLARPIWLLQQPRPKPGALLEGAEARQRTDLLAGVSVDASARRPPDLLVLVGGDTAIRILRRLGVQRLSVERELLPGMPLCSAEIDGRPALVVIKPGSFGGGGTLLALLSRAGWRDFAPEQRRRG